MPAPAAVIIHGQTPATDILDEDNYDVSEFKTKMTRETRDRKDHNGNLRRREYFNPLVQISFNGMVKSFAGLAIQHPGTRVTALLNYAAETRGFDPSVGTIMIDDIEDTRTLEEDLKSAFNMTHAPFVVSA